MRYDYTQKGTRFDGKRIFLTTTYPEIPITDSDFYITSTLGDRLDLLANRFYKDPNYWWIIAQANSIGKGSLSVPPGTQLRIPANLGTIISNFKNANQ